VAGWLKRGPTGVIGTNKSDAAGSVRSLLSDWAGGGAERGDAAQPGDGGRRPLEKLLAARGVMPVSYVDWLRVEQAEAALGGELGRGARVKLPGREALESICRPPAS
jgi:ferredoxin/flavodoxin---NADP+ reductase